MKLFAALREDAHQGWVLLKNPSIVPRAIVKITNSDNGKSIYCEALQLDSNYLRTYNQSPRIPIDDPRSVLVLNGWYRDKLGGLPTQEDVNLTISSHSSWWGQFRACTHHPQIVVRVAAWLGFVSVFLGLLGVLLGWMSFWGCTKTDDAKAKGSPVQADRCNKELKWAVSTCDREFKEHQDTRKHADCLAAARSNYDTCMDPGAK